MDRYLTERLDAAVDSLLGQEPRARVMAMDDSGVTVPMPSAVPLSGHALTTGRTSALNTVRPQDVVQVVRAWQTAMESGSAMVVVRLADDPETDVTLTVVDQRHRWGVFLSFTVGATGPAADPVGTDFLRPRVGTVVKNAFGSVLSCDVATTRMLGWTAGELVGRRSQELLHPDDQAAGIAAWMEMLRSPGRSVRARLRHARADGTWQWVDVANENLLTDPAHGVVRATIVDVSEEMAATEALRAGELLLRRLTDALPVGVVQLDAAGAVVYRNDRLRQLLGHPVGSVDDLLADLVVPDVLRAAIADAWAGTDVDLAVRLGGDGRVRHLDVTVRALVSDAGVVTGALLCLADTTEATVLREELAREARVDGLTECLRRNAAIEHLEDLLVRLGGPDAPTGSVTVLFVDLDGFKTVNDRLGHAAGDDLLREVGHRLLGAAGAHDVVGRLGGDEFVVVVPGLLSPSAADAAADRLTAVLSEPVHLAGEDVVPHASVGVAWTAEPVAADALVARADAAMYASKRRRPDRRRLG